MRQMRGLKKNALYVRRKESSMTQQVSLPLGDICLLIVVQHSQASHSSQTVNLPPALMLTNRSMEMAVSVSMQVTDPNSWKVSSDKKGVFGIRDWLWRQSTPDLDFQLKTRLALTCLCLENRPWM